MSCETDLKFSLEKKKHKNFIVIFEIKEGSCNFRDNRKVYHSGYIFNGYKAIRVIYLHVKIFDWTFLKVFEIIHMYVLNVISNCWYHILEFSCSNFLNLDINKLSKHVYYALSIFLLGISWKLVGECTLILLQQLTRKKIAQFDSFNL